MFDQVWKKNVADNAVDREVKCQATSLHQTSEQGMHGFQSLFPHIKDCVKFECNGERKHVMKLMIYLYNLWSHCIGINQIQNVYLPYLQKEASDMTNY